MQVCARSAERSTRRDTGPRRPGAGAAVDARRAWMRDRLRRVELLNRVLRPLALSVDEWEGTAYVLRTRTGESVLCADLATLFVEAERLAAAPARPARRRAARALERRREQDPDHADHGLPRQRQDDAPARAADRSRRWGRPRCSSTSSARSRSTTTCSRASTSAPSCWPRAASAAPSAPTWPTSCATSRHGARAGRSRATSASRSRRPGWRIPRRSSRRCSPIRWSRPSTASTGSSRPSTPSTASRSCGASRRRPSRRPWRIGCCSRRPTSSSPRSSPSCAGGSPASTRARGRSTSGTGACPRAR